MPGPSHGELVRSLASIASESGLTEIEVSEAGMRVRIRRSHACGAMASPQVHQVTSPWVGTVRMERPREVGTLVRTGDVLLAIECLGTSGNVVAAHPGRLVSLLVRDAQPVEYGEPLALIERDAVRSGLGMAADMPATALARACATG